MSQPSMQNAAALDDHKLPGDKITVEAGQKNRGAGNVLGCFDPTEGTLIDSGLASILNGTVPLFTILIAHFWLHDEKITLGRIAGLIVGLIFGAIAKED